MHTVTSVLNTRFSRIAQLILQQSSSQILGGSVVAGNDGCFSLPYLVTAPYRDACCLAQTRHEIGSSETGA
jgi:hypothetical protein